MKRIKSNDLLSLSIVLFTFILLTACGGGGSGGGGGTPGATNTATISAGEIEGFGSIIVNGVRFDTSSTEFELENEGAGTEADLQEGMQVTVEGTSNGANGTATRVRFEDNLEGPISSVTASPSGLSKNMEVLGQTVRVEQGVTQFDNSDPGFDFASLGAGNVGNVVEVSGHDMADGSIQATFIQRKALTLADFLAAAGVLEIKGTLSNLTATTFQIGTLVIDYATADVRDPLSEGLPVEVKSTDADLTDGVLTALSVEANLPGLDQNDVAKAEVEGFIAGLNTGAQTFMLNGQMVNYANATFRGGFEDELANNIKVEAEGPLAGGVINATKVTFKESIKFEANAASVAGNSLTLQGLPGITIQADEGITRFDNFTAFTDLAPGNNLRVRARPAGTGGGMVAVRIVLRDDLPDDRVIAQGQVDVNGINSAAGTVTMLNGLVTVNTNEIVDNNSQDDSPGDSDFEIEDTPVSQGAFFAALVDGDTVKARARLADPAGGDAKTWHAIEIEVEDDN